MVRCKQCGGAVPSGNETCPSCGAPVHPTAADGQTDDELYVEQGASESTAGRSPPGQSTSSEPPDSSAQQPTETAAGPATDGPDQSAGQQGGQRQPAGQRNRADGDGNENGVGRRELLIGGVALAGVAAGGVFFLGSDGNDSPEAVMERYYREYADGDVEALNDLTHTESPDYPVDDQLTEEVLQQLREEIDVDVEETELVEENDDVAVVEITVTFSGQNRENTETDRWELRTEDGEWKVWGPTPRNEVADTPAVQFDFTFAADTGTLEITHTGGDAIQADRLRIEGEGLEATGFWYEFDTATAQDEEVFAGDAVEIGASSTYSVDLVWTGSDGNSMVLGTDDGPDA